MTRIASHGLAVEVPPGWDARIYRREPEAGATSHPIVHAATFPLPGERGDFGSGAVELMGPDDVLVVLVEFHVDAAATPTFERHGWPAGLDPAAFDPFALQRTLPGQSGLQRFFTHKGRPFCLYVVLGSHARRGLLARRAEALLAGIAVGG